MTAPGQAQLPQRTHATQTPRRCVTLNPSHAVPCHPAPQKRQQQLDEAASSSKTKKPESKAELTAELSRKLSMRQERARLEEDSSSPLVLSGREPATPDVSGGVVGVGLVPGGWVVGAAAGHGAGHA